MSIQINFHLFFSICFVCIHRYAQLYVISIAMKTYTMPPNHIFSGKHVQDEHYWCKNSSLLNSLTNANTWKRKKRTRTIKMEAVSYIKDSSKVL